MWLQALGKKSSQAGQPAGSKRKLARRHTPVSVECSELDAARFDDGTFLDVFASECVRRAIVKLGRPFSEGEFDVGSGCTGSAMDKVALTFVETALQAEGIRIKFRTPYICEMDREKAQWAQKVHAALSPSDLAPCSYMNLMDFEGSAEVKCHIDNHRCNVKAFQDGLIVGISCKAHSKANNNRKTITGVGDSFQGLLALLDRMPTDWLLIENVEEFASEEDREIDENWSLLVVALSERGFDTQGFKVSPEDYGLPQKRKRLYGVSVRRPGRRVEVTSAQTFFDNVQALLQDFKIKGPSLPKIILEQNDLAVDDELDKRLRKPTKDWDSSTIQAHRLAWSQAGGRWAATPPSKADTGTPWYGTLAAREKDKLAFHYWKYSGKRDLHSRVLGTDLGQSIGRETWMHVDLESGRIFSPTVCPKCKLWVSFSKAHHGVERHGLLIGKELMHLQGFPVNHQQLRALAEKQQSDNGSFLANLAGNAFPSTIMTSLLVALVFALEFKPASDTALASTSDDVEAALRLQKRRRS